MYICDTERSFLTLLDKFQTLACNRLIFIKKKKNTYFFISENLIKMNMISAFEAFSSSLDVKRYSFNMYHDTLPITIIHTCLGRAFKKVDPSHCLSLSPRIFSYFLP